MRTSFQSNAKLSGYIFLDRTLEIIQDIQWHNLDEIVKVIPMPSDKLNEVLCFLQEQALVERKNEMLRITCLGLKFLQLKS